jgi:hypothetical protein
MSSHDSLGHRTGPRTDGGEDDESADDRGGGGWFSRLFPGRDERIQSLRRQLQQAERDKSELEDEVDRLQRRVDELEATGRELSSENEAFKRRQFAFDALLASVGRSFQQANDDLAGSNVVVGDLDVTLRADVSGGGTQDGLDLRLVDPDEEIDADRLSTVSFSVGRRGRLRHRGRPDSLTPGGGMLQAGTPPTEAPEGTTGTEEPPSGPPVEVPNVLGLSADEAKTELREEGFGVHSDGDDDGTVVEQWPRAFAVAPKGSSVVIIVDGEAEG